MRLTVCTFFFIVLASISGVAQEKPIEIIGEIINSETGEPVPYVHVVNDNLGKGTVSNNQGRFWITMEKSDTLLISAIGFETFAYILKEKVSTERLLVTIELDHSTMELQPVKVFAFRNEEALKQALVDTKAPLNDPKRGIELPGFYYGPEKEVKISPFGSPLSFIASKFSREIKEKKRLEQYQRDQDYQGQIQAKYNEAVVIDLTGLPEDKVEEFMAYCKLENSFLGPATSYEIAVEVNKCFVSFQELMNSDSLEAGDDH